GMLTLAPPGSRAADDVVSTGLEIAAFGLVALWMVQLIIRKRHRPFATPLKITVPLSALVILIGLQVVPLPPSLLGTISPSTFRLYSRTLHGWPESAPYRALVTKMGGRTSEPRHSVIGALGNWRTISLAPSVTRSPFVLFIGYTSIFFVVLR